MNEFDSSIVKLCAEEKRLLNSIVRTTLKATELLEMKTRQLDSICQILADMQNRLLALEKEIYLTQKEQQK